MKKSRRAQVLVMVGLGVGLLVPGPAPAPASSQPAPPPKAEQPLKAEQLTREQFDRLPDTQPIEMKGQRTTAGEIRTKMKQARAEAEVKMKAAAAQAQAGFEADRVQFLQAQKARLDAENAKVRQQRPAAAQSPQFDAIRREAGQLLERSKTASPAERAQIEQRAAQLLQQLRQGERR